MKQILTTIGSLAVAGLIIRLWTEHSSNSFRDWLWLFGVIAIAIGFYLLFMRDDHNTKKWRKLAIIVVMIATVLCIGILCTMPST